MYNFASPNLQQVLTRVYLQIEGKIIPSAESANSSPTCIYPLLTTNFLR